MIVEEKLEKYHSLEKVPYITDLDVSSWKQGRSIAETNANKLQHYTNAVPVIPPPSNVDEGKIVAVEDEHYTLIDPPAGGTKVTVNGVEQTTWNADTKVNTTGDETVGGVKTFSDGIKTNDITDSTAGTPLRIFDANDPIILQSGGGSVWWTGQCFYPEYNGTLSLGKQGNVWNGVYVRRIYSDLDIALQSSGTTISFDGAHNRIRPSDDHNTEIGASDQRFKTVYATTVDTTKINSMDVPTNVGNGVVQAATKYLRIQNDGTTGDSLVNDEYTDIFVYTGKLIFKSGFTGKQIKTFYCNSGVTLENDGGAVNKINVDFTEHPLPYTTEGKIHLVGYTQADDNTICPLFQTEQEGSGGGGSADSIVTNEVKNETAGTSLQIYDSNDPVIIKSGENSLIWDGIDENTKSLYPNPSTIYPKINLGKQSNHFTEVWADTWVGRRLRVDEGSHTNFRFPYIYDTSTTEREIQLSTNVLLVDNDGTTGTSIGSKCPTDIFVKAGKVRFTEDTIWEQFKTFYCNEGVTLESGFDSRVPKINVDFVEQTLPYTTTRKMHLVGFTPDGVLLFQTENPVIPYPTAADAGKTLKVNADGTGFEYV